MTELNAEQQALVAQGLPYSETAEQQQESIKAELNETFDPSVAVYVIPPDVLASMPDQSERDQYIKLHPDVRAAARVVSQFSPDVIDTMTPEEKASLPILPLEEKIGLYNRRVETFNLANQGEYDLAQAQSIEDYINAAGGNLNYYKGLAPADQQVYLDQLQTTQEMDLGESIIKAGGSVEVYKSLPTEEAKQNYLQMIQVSAQARGQLAFFKGAMDLAEFQSTHVQVGPASDNQWMIKTDFDALPTDAQESIRQGGLSGWDIATTPLARFAWLEKNKLIPEGSIYTGEDSEGNPMIIVPDYTGLQEVLPSGKTVWETKKDQLLSQDLQSNAGFFDIQGGYGEYTDNVNIAFSKIPFNKRVYGTALRNPQGTYTDYRSLSESQGLTMDRAYVINIRETWNNLTDSEKALVLTMYDPAPNPALEQIKSSIPVYKTVENWDSLKGYEKVASILMDTAFIAGIGLALVAGVSSIRTVLERPVAGIGRMEVPLTTGESATVWKGIHVLEHPVIGKTPEGITIGARNIGLPNVNEINLNLWQSPITKLEWNVVRSDTALKSLGLDDAEIARLTANRELGIELTGKTSPYYTGKAEIPEVTTISKNGVVDVLKYVKAHPEEFQKVAGRIGGSFAQESQLAPEMRAIRKVGDIDIYTSVGNEATERLAREILRILEGTEGKGNVRMSLANLSRIETRDPITGQWSHAVELHSGVEASASSVSGISPEGRWGVMYDDGTVIMEYPGIGKVRVMPLSEQLKRKAIDSLLKVHAGDKYAQDIAGSITRGEIEYGTGVDDLITRLIADAPESTKAILGPQAHRLWKDVVDTYRNIYTFKGQEAADAWARLWGFDPNSLRTLARALEPEIAGDFGGATWEFIPEDVTVASPRIAVYPSVNIARALPTVWTGADYSIPVKDTAYMSSPNYKPFPYGTSIIPSAVPSPITSPSGTVSPSLVPSPSGAVSPYPSPSVSPSPSPSPYASPSPSPAPSPSPSPSPVPSPSPSPSPYPSPSPSPSIVPSPSPSPSIPPSMIPSPPVSRTPPPPIILPPSPKVSSLSKKQLEGSVAWKQGWCYKLIYPPYGQENIINSRYSFPGMKIHRDARSAFKTLIQIVDGTLPSTITRDMGIMDISIDVMDNPSSNVKHTLGMKYRLDRHQQTQTIPKIVRG